MRILFLVLFACMQCAWAAQPNVAAGRNFSMALNSKGDPFSWGIDNVGQLGRNRTLWTGEMTRVPDLPPVRELSTRGGFVLALADDGSVWGWGAAFYGELTTGSPAPFNSPAKLLNLPSINAVSAGLRHGIALDKDGNVWTWGANSLFQLGVKSEKPRPTPDKVLGLPKIRYIAAGDYFNVAVDKDGGVWTWGDNQLGQINNSDDSAIATPIKIFTLPGIVEVKAGNHHTLARLKDGSVWSWGSAWDNVLGTGSQRRQYQPVQVKNLSNIKSLAVAKAHNIAVDGNGLAWSWGSNSSGQLGHPDHVLPQPIPTLSNVSASGVGADHSLAISNGRLFGWGYNTFGQIANGSAGDSEQNPVPSPSEKSFVLLAGSENNSYALTRDGQVWASGDNRQGQLGEIAGVFRVVATPIALQNLMSLAAGSDHTVVLKENGEVWGWGSNQYGQVGNTDYSYFSRPTQIPELKGVQALAAGSFHTLALKDDGTVWGFGENRNGQTGNAITSRFHHEAVRVTGIGNVKAIAAGGNHSLAIRSDGTVWAWGGNTFGQLGIGTVAQTDRPKQMMGLNRIIAIAGGSEHTIALDADGVVWAVGHNSYGQLGTGDKQDSWTAAPVPGLTDIVAIAAGTQHSLAVKRDGSAWGWGNNEYGQISNLLETEEVLTPTRIPNLDNAQIVAAGTTHSLAMRRDGYVYGWGANWVGQAGDGTIALKSKLGVAVNPEADSLVDLISTGINEPLSVAVRPPFLVEVKQSATRLKATIKDTRALLRQAFAQGYSVYVGVRLAKDALINGQTPYSNWYMKDRLIGWNAYAGGPIPEYLAGVSINSQDELVKIEVLSDVDLSQLTGSQFYIGYGQSAEDMLNRCSYRVIYEVTDSAGKIPPEKRLPTGTCIPR